MRRLRRLYVTGAAILLLLGVSSVSGFGQIQDYPTRQIRILVGYGAGGVVDIIARMVTSELSTRLGQPIVVEI